MTEKTPPSSSEPKNSLLAMHERIIEQLNASGLTGEVMALSTDMQKSGVSFVPRRATKLSSEDIA